MTDLLKPNEPARRSAERMEEKPDTIPLGSWHWLQVETNEGKIEDRLVCVTAIGSNYAQVETPGGTTWHFHVDKWDEETRPEPNHRAVIERRIEEKKKSVSALMAKVQEVTARLGMAPTNVDETGTALATLSNQTDVDGYKAALEKAKKDELPELFKEIESENKALSKWMKAEMLPVKAIADRAKGVVKEIENRILNVEIYAVITEEVKRVRKGEPAGFAEKLRVFQAKLYMDEECLLDYQAGGMDFEKIGEFDRWLSKKKNLERILPFPRCMVAMQVRRTKKDRDGDEDYEGILGAYLRFKHEAFDEWTFLYVRNGEQLYRINSKVEFGKLIFPSRDEFKAEPMVFKGHGDDVEFKTVREHEVDVANAKEKKRLQDEWVKKNPYRKWKKQKQAEWKKERKEAFAKAKKTGELVSDRLKADRPPDFSEFSWEHANPHGRHGWDDPTRLFDQWEPFDKSSVHYDEALEALKNRARQWNRVALMIQGLFDRSEILHPHPKVESWTAEGFASAIELVYDGEHALYDGTPPNFEAYRAKLNETLGEGSITIGQEDVWLAREQAKEHNRRAGDGRLKWSEKNVSAWWRPFDNTGPGRLAKVAEWSPKAGKATFRWTRNRRGGSYRDRWGVERSHLIEMSIQVKAESLLNVSAYRKGDYLQFFRDPRTRADYMKWAPMLLTCEDWLAGKTKVAVDDD